MFYNFLWTLLFPAKNIFFIIIKEYNCSSDTDFIYDKCIDYGKNKTIFMHAGAFSTYMANKLSQINYRCIDSGSFAWGREPYSNDFLYSIENLLYKFYYKIDTKLSYKSNNDCDILDSKFVIDNTQPLIFTLNSMDNISYFNLQFNMPIGLYKCTNILYNIKISTNQNCTLFTGFTSIKFDKLYECDAIFDLNKWYISPSFETKEFIIYNVALKIISIGGVYQ
jgi:hypothetical protein